ncbi:MAG TPA: methyltransferase domain-containing protein [Myxococcota bacterium]|nr:methyltransferase domain-containing protein [Myxococcota bacterium]
MSLSDPRYVADQYRSSVHFDARARIYELFDAGAERWPAWLFSRLGLDVAARVLEVGCGTGALWRENAARIPARTSLTLTDLSRGMLGAARASLAQLAPPPRFGLADAQSLPFADASFDFALANHMLYHVADRGRALGELARVLAPGGRLVVATNAWTHLIELRELVHQVGIEAALLAPRREASEFDLEAAAEEVAAVLGVERVERRDSALEITDVDALVAYVRSVERVASPEAALARLRAAVARRIELAGAFHVGIAAGFVAARKPVA